MEAEYDMGNHEVQLLLPESQVSVLVGPDDLVSSLDLVLSRLLQVRLFISFSPRFFVSVFVIFWHLACPFLVTFFLAIPNGEIVFFDG